MKPNRIEFDFSHKDLETERKAYDKAVNERFSSLMKDIEQKVIPAKPDNTIIDPSTPQLSVVAHAVKIALVGSYPEYRKSLL